MEDEKRINIFNQGYLLQKHNPELLKQLLTNMDKRSSYLKTLKDGSLQFKMEQSRDMKKGGEKNSILEDKDIKGKENKSPDMDI